MAPDAGGSWNSDLAGDEAREDRTCARADLAGGAHLIDLRPHAIKPAARLPPPPHPFLLSSSPRLDHGQLGRQAERARTFFRPRPRPRALHAHIRPAHRSQTPLLGGTSALRARAIPRRERVLGSPCVTFLSSRDLARLSRATQTELRAGLTTWVRASFPSLAPRTG